jgi:hypothetical protein
MLEEVGHPLGIRRFEKDLRHLLIGHPDAASVDHPLGAGAPIELGVGVEDDITLLSLRYSAARN